jgi:Na+/proline symporter
MFVFYHFEKPPLNFNESYKRLLVARAPAEYAELERNHEAAFEGRRRAAIALEQARSTGGNAESEVRRYLAAQEALRQVSDSNRSLLSKFLGTTPSAEINYVFPSFLLHYAPAGVLGIMIAVIFAAAMSTFSSEINSLASATVIDFYKRYCLPEATDRHYLLVSRGVTVFWGLFATTAAVFAGRLGSLIEAVNKVGSYFYGPILGVFLLAFFARRSNAAGAFWGLLAGEVSVLVVAYYSSISWLYYNVVGAATVVLAGSLISRISQAKRSRPVARA